jgi:disulfide bond formation protein DsbB
MSIETLNYLLALGTLGMLVVAAGFFALYFLRSKYPDLNDIGKMLTTWGTHLSFLLASTGAFFTLFYSEVLGFDPCFLCWWQRICLYPQILIFGLALKKPALRSSAIIYSMWLSAFGTAFALYHHVLQVFPAGNLPCSANGPSCAKITFIEFGFVTYPMMALALFALLMVIQLFSRERQA